MVESIYLKGKIDGKSIQDEKIEVTQEFVSLFNEKKKNLESRRSQH